MRSSLQRRNLRARRIQRRTAARQRAAGHDEQPHSPPPEVVVSSASSLRTVSEEASRAASLGRSQRRGALRRVSKEPSDASMSSKIERMGSHRSGRGNHYHHHHHHLSLPDPTTLEEEIEKRYGVPHHSRQSSKDNERHHHHHHHHHHHKRQALEAESRFRDVDELETEILDEGFPVFQPRLCPWPYPWKTYWEDKMQVKNEILSGITVAFAQVPEAIAFSFLANLPDPGMGLHACWIMGIGMALYGRRPGMITGATGAVAAVIAGTMKFYGHGYLPYIIILGGIIQALCGVLRLAKFVKMIPITVMMGFTNGLALLIALAQTHTFEVSQYQCDHALLHEVPEDQVCKAGEWIWNDQAAGGTLTAVLMVFIMLITMVIVQFLPRLTKIVPSSLVAILFGIAFEQVIRAASDDYWHTPLLGEFAQLDNSPPTAFFLNHHFQGEFAVPFNWETFGIVLGPAFFLAGVVVLEELMTIEVVGEQTSTPTLQPNGHLIALGFFQVVAGFLGTMGGGAMIGLTMINVHSGSNGRYRISALVTAVSVMIVAFVAAPAVKLLPTSSIVGVMAIVVIHTFNWGSILLVAASLLPRRIRHHPRVNFMRKIHRADALIIVVVTALTLIIDLFVGTIAGVLVAAFAFAWQSAHRLRVDTELTTDDEGKTVKVYHLDGPVFYGTVQPLLHLFTAKSDPDVVEIHMHRASLYDYSALDALNQIGERYAAVGKTFHIRHLSVQSEKVASNAASLVKHFTYSRVEKVGPEVHLDPVSGLHLARKSVDSGAA